MPDQTVPTEEIEIPDYILNPDMEMPVEHIDGQDYIGVLAIPGLELKLPVISEWSYPRLKIAPCRYAGSAYTGDLIISAHNYSSHFGKLNHLRVGDTMTFTDIDGNVFHYKVMEIYTLKPYRHRGNGKRRLGSDPVYLHRRRPKPGNRAM